MITFKFKLDEWQLDLAKSVPLGTALPESRYIDYIPIAKYELVVDGRVVPIARNKVPIISLADQLKRCLSTIAIGETKRLCFMDDGGFFHVSRPSADTITIIDMYPDVPQTTCSFFELKAAVNALCLDVFESMTKEFPELLECEGDLIKELLLSQN